MGSLLRGWHRVPFSLGLGPIVLLGFTLRVIGLGASDLWLDEAISAFHARNSIAEILAMSSARVWVHPPGFYLLLHFWVKWAGDSEFALRFLSVSGGMFGIVLLAIVARRWFDPRLAWLAALFMAVNPRTVQHSSDVRMYAWLMATTLLSVYLLDRALITNRLRYWGLFALALALSTSIHYFFGFVLAAYAFFLVVRWRSLPLSRKRFATVLAVLLAAALLAILARQGPRESIMQLMRGHQQEPIQFAPMAPLFLNWATDFTENSPPRLMDILPSLVVWVTIALGIFTMPQPRQWSRRNLQWLMALLIFLPFLLVIPVFPYANGRHLSATLGLTLLAILLAIFALYRLWKPLGVAVFIGYLAVFCMQSFPHGSQQWRPFSSAVAHISENARQSDVIVYTGYGDWAQNDQYNRRGLATEYIPSAEGPVSDAEIALAAEAVLARNPVVWLNLYPGLATTEQVERAFNRLAFPASKRWFAGDRGVIHYFGPSALEEEAGGQSWEDGIELMRWWHSGDGVTAGDALRLQFDWRKTRAPPDGDLRQDRPLLVSLSLVGADGQVWASRLEEPCIGTCPVSEWGDAPVSDRLAFYVPPDVPPGTYELRLGWVDENGGALLGRPTAGALAEVSIPLMTIEVRPAVDQPSPDGDLRPAATAPGEPVATGLTLLSSDPVKVAGQAGSSFTLPLRFRVEAEQPPLNLRLHLTPTGAHSDARGDREIAQPAGPAWYPSDLWAPGSVVRAQPQFQVPGDLAAGSYALALEVMPAHRQEAGKRIQLGSLTVEDRPRSFALPDLGVAVDAHWNEGIRLARLAMPPSAQQGGSADITLVWEAAGPASRDWKVFVHLLDNEGIIRAQVDGYPDGGGAPTNSWQAGEVVVDTHTMSIPADLPPQEYRLRLGLYDAATGERLLMPAGADSLELPTRLQVVGG